MGTRPTQMNRGTCPPPRFSWSRATVHRPASKNTAGGRTFRTEDKYIVQIWTKESTGADHEDEIFRLADLVDAAIVAAPEDLDGVVGDIYLASTEPDSTDAYGTPLGSGSLTYIVEYFG